MTLIPNLKSVALSGRAREQEASVAEPETRALMAFSLGQDALRGGSGERQRLVEVWGESNLRSLDSLQRESDSGLFAESLLNLALGLVREDRLEAAQLVFTYLAERPDAAHPDLARRARRELDAIQGRGELGPRLEFLARRFTREVTRPEMLAGMAVASTVFQLSRVALLARLSSTPSLGLLSRGLGARAVAGLGAYALEAPAFALTVWGSRIALGDPTASATPFSHELFGSYLTLGGLKLFGALGRGAVGLAGAGPVSRALIPQVSTYFGIVAGHRLEQWAGLRPHLSGDTLWADSLVTLLQFHVGGRLAHQLGGPRLAAWQRQLELQGERLAEGAGPVLGFPPPMALTPAFAGARILSSSRPAEDIRPGLVFMMQGGENGGPLRGERGPGRNGGRRASVPLGERNTFQIVEELVRCRNRIRRRGVEDPSLWQLMRRKLDEGAIPAERAEELQWAVYSRSLFENSPILQREFRGETAPNFDSVALRLHELRAKIALEQGQESYSLATLTQALAYGGRLPYEKLRGYVAAGTTLDFYQQTPGLREVGKEFFTDPYRLIRRLREITPSIEAQREQQYQLSTLVNALRWHPEFPRSQLQTYVMAAAASDYVRGLDLRQLRLDSASLSALTLEQVFLRLLHLKPVLLGESGDSLSIGYVLLGLRSEGLESIKDAYLNDSAITHAHVLDFAFNRWNEWGGHYRNLVEIPKKGEGTGSRAGWTRPRYAARHLLKENGQPYSYSYASNLVRWGEFLWRHREALGLPAPNAQEVAPLESSRRSRLFAFLEPHWEALREKTQAPEEFLEGMIGLRREFSRDTEERSAVAEGEPGATPSLRVMVGALFKAKGREVPRSLEVYAAIIDTILQRWPEWRRPLRSLSEVSAPGHAGTRERYRIAEQNFFQSNGEPYSKNILGSLIRWGGWVWENRSRLGLRGGESTVPPPSQDEK